MARNVYPGQCYCCGAWVEPGYGHFEKIRGAAPGTPKWRIKCVKCASGRVLTDKDPGVKWAQQQAQIKKEDKSMYNNVPTKVLTGEVRLSYVNLVAPRVNRTDPNGTPKYSVTLLIPKTDAAVYQNILQSIEAAAVDAQNKLWGGVRPPVMPVPIHDGDGVRDNGTPYGPECKGCWVITASTKNKPQVVHQSDINTDLLPQDIYSGMYARVTINFFGYNTAGKRGIGCGLGNVMKTRDGEPLAGGASAAADFAGIGQAVGAPATPGYGGAMPATPGQMTYPNTGYTPPAPAAPAPGPGYGTDQYGQQAAPGLGLQPGAINPLTGQPYYPG